jgi:hypothetical protein
MVSVTRISDGKPLSMHLLSMLKIHPRLRIQGCAEVLVFPTQDAEAVLRLAAAHDGVVDHVGTSSTGSAAPHHAALTDNLPA